MTNVNAREAGCGAPGAGIQTDHGRDVPDTYVVKNSLFSTTRTVVTSTPAAAIAADPRR
jgi:hypothetical protein